MVQLRFFPLFLISFCQLAGVDPSQGGMPSSRDVSLKSKQRQSHPTFTVLPVFVRTGSIVGHVDVDSTSLTSGRPLVYVGASVARSYDFIGVGGKKLMHKCDLWAGMGTRKYRRMTVNQ